MAEVRPGVGAALAAGESGFLTFSQCFNPLLECFPPTAQTE
jgi:hypothetical protein